MHERRRFDASLGVCVVCEESPPRIGRSRAAILSFSERHRHTEVVASTNGFA